MEAANLFEQQNKKSPKWNNLVKKFVDNLDYSFRSEFGRQSSNEDRVLFCMSHLNVQELIADYFAHWNSGPLDLLAKKDIKKSDAQRLSGNELFRKGKFTEALCLYTFALVSAPEYREFDPNCDVEKFEDAKSSPLIYGNRSAAYYYLSDYENAIRDIDASLALHYKVFKPNDVVKLNFRKCTCLIKLGRINEAKVVLEQIPEGHRTKIGSINTWNELHNSIISAIDTKLFADSKTSKSCKDISLEDLYSFWVKHLTSKKLFRSHPKLSSLSSKLELCHDSVSGRNYLVAKENIQFGDVLAMVKPFATALIEQTELNYCHHCCRLLQLPSSGISQHRSIPCAKCSGPLYCSEQCRRVSWQTYHRYECGLLPIINQNQLWHLALKVFYITGLEKIRKVVACSVEEITKLSDPEDYSHIYKLEHHSDKRPDEEMIEMTLDACLLLHVVKLGGFMANGQSGSSEKPEVIEKFVGGILLRHLLQFSICAQTLYNVSLDNTPPIAIGLNGILSLLLKPSCDANTHLGQTGMQNGQLALEYLQADRPIPAGTQLTAAISGGASFTRFTRAERQKKIQDEFFMECHCARCETELRDNPNPFGTFYPTGCSKCNSLITKRSGSFKCDNCDLEFTIKEMKCKYEEIELKLTEAKTLMKAIENDFCVGTNATKHIGQLELLITTKLGAGSLLHRTSSWKLANLYNSLGHYHYRLGGAKFCAKACIELEQCARILENVHGPISLELYQQLKKMQLLYEKILESNAASIDIYEQFRFVDTRVKNLEAMQISYKI